LTAGTTVQAFADLSLLKRPENLLLNASTIIIGIVIIALAIVITVFTKGAGAAIFVGIAMGISVITATLVSGFTAYANGVSFLGGALEGFANGLLFLVYFQ